MPSHLDPSPILLVAFFGYCYIQSIVRGQHNNTLIYAADNNIRNCSCSTDIPDCDYNLAQLTCSCRTVHLHTVDGSLPRFSYSSDLIIWFKDTSTLSLLLNFSFVHDLKLSLCEQAPLPTEYLAILGLRRLRTKSEVNAQYTEQSLVINNGNGKNTKDSFRLLPGGPKALFDVAYLDTALCNGFHSLKSYSVENVSNIGEQFPYLPYSNVFSLYNKTYTVTLIY